VKIAAAGGNTCDCVRAVLKRLDVSRFIGPAMLLTNPENAYRTVTVGSNSFVHLSLALSDASKVWTWDLSTVRTAMGESQDLISAARGCKVMSFFVCFLYSLKAAVKIVSKFGEDDEVDGSFGSWDIVYGRGLVRWLGR
jgi:hypothetical protein